MKMVVLVLAAIMVSGAALPAHARNVAQCAQLDHTAQEIAHGAPGGWISAAPVATKIEFRNAIEAVLMAGCVSDYDWEWVDLMNANIRSHAP